MANIILCGGISWEQVLMRPIGIYQLANVLRKNGYTVQVIDYFPFIAGRGIETVKQIFDKFVDADTLWIGFSSTWFTKIAELENNIKEDNTPTSTVQKIKHADASFVYKDTKTFIDNTFLFSDEEFNHS
jgi:hypothetical protein